MHITKASSHYIVTKNRYRACINKDKKRYVLGHFKTNKEAYNKKLQNYMVNMQI